MDKAQGFYILKKLNGKILILLQNPIMHSDTYSRHELQYIEILPSGEKAFHNAGYTGVNGEISNTTENKVADWIFDKNDEMLRPVKHISRDEKGKIKFIELWNYKESEPVKYEMKDAKGKAVSIIKEVQESDSNYRKEHLFYDNNGSITMSITINYDGANISRFTYFNSHSSIDSISIISEYDNGLKVKESIYDENYNLVNIFIAEYDNGVRKNIKVFDAEGNQVDKISS